MVSVEKNIDLAQFVDHTVLLPGTLSEDIKKLCKEAKNNKFYAVCVTPVNVGLACKELIGSNVKVAAVVGFPLGENTTKIKVAETIECVENGASEIDMVINISALKDGNYDLVKNEIAQIVEAATPRATVKVIIETGLLTDNEKVKACQLSCEAKAAFVKTSTGMLKSGKGATIEDVELMYKTVKDCGLKVKASGGVRDRETVLAMINAGAERIGTSSGISILSGDSAKVGSGY